MRKKTDFKKLQIFKNKVLRIIIKFRRVTPNETLQNQTGMETIKSHISSLVRKLGILKISSITPK
jgi:hypothetical protein